MNIIVVGCGRVGSELAYGLYRRGHKVVVIDLDRAAFQNLPPDFRGRTLEGDVLLPDVLVRAGIDDAEALAAVTPNDTVNAVIGHMARVAFNVPNIVVRDYDPRKRALYEAFGLQIVSPSAWGAQRIEEMLSKAGLRMVVWAGNGEVEIYEFTVPSAWDRRAIHELMPHEECRVAAITRAGRAMLPQPDDALEAGDLVHFSATKAGIEALRQQLERVQED